VIKNNDRKLAEDLRKLDDTVDELYSDIKYYLTKISREALSENEGRAGPTSSASPSTWSRSATSSSAC
jgi:phosphate:Na+ symporter